MQGGKDLTTTSQGPVGKKKERRPGVEEQRKTKKQGGKKAQRGRAKRVGERRGDKREDMQEPQWRTKCRFELKGNKEDSGSE